MTVAASDQRFFRGRTLKIHSVNRVEIMVELPFDICLRKIFTLDQLGFDVEQLDDDDFGKAQHALVVLLGGKKVIVEPELSQREHWGHRPSLAARVYLDERVHGRPVGLTNGILSESVLEVSPFFSWVAEQGFDLSAVKRVLNGKGGKRG